MQNRTLTNAFWGVFLIWFGLLVALPGAGGNPLNVVNNPLFTLGTGVLMLLLNFLRTILRLRLSVVTTFLGILLTVIYAPIILFGFSVQFLPALLIILGAAIIIGAGTAFRRRRGRTTGKSDETKIY